MNTTPLLEELREFLRLPSAAGNAQGLRRTADWLTGRLRSRGWQVRVEDDGQAPPLLAAECGEGPLVAVYSHYDVVNPLRSEWRHDPFGADLVDGRVIACGARDAKANLLGAVRAGEASSSVRLLLLFEGEEKRESPRLLDFARRVLAGRLPVGFLCADGGGYTDRDEPTMELGLKGQLALEVEVGAGTPGVSPTSIHSGHATLAVNPNDLLARFLASLKDAAGRVTLAGFYEAVLPPERPYREPLAEGEASFLQTLFVRYGYALRSGETRAEVFNRLMFQPELNIASVRSGETGLEKRIVPARASARLDLNLVPGQEPEAVLAAVRERLREHGIEPERALRVLAARPAYRCPPDDPFAVAARKALAETHPGKAVIVLPSSGSSGPVSGLPRAFGRPLARLGTGYRGHAHTPDEAVKIRHYELYIATLPAFFGKVAGL